MKLKRYESNIFQKKIYPLFTPAQTVSVPKDVGTAWTEISKKTKEVN